MEVAPRYSRSPEALRDVYVPAPAAPGRRPCCQRDGARQRTAATGSAAARRRDHGGNDDTGTASSERARPTVPACAMPSTGQR